MSMALRHSRYIKIAAVALGVAAAICVYGMFDPATTPFPKCWFLGLTGWKCPGCGSQRAIHALLQGRLAEAWHLNALFVALLPLVALLLVAELLRVRCPRFYAGVHSRALILVLVAVILLWWVGRNLPL